MTRGRANRSAIGQRHPDPRRPPQRTSKNILHRRRDRISNGYSDYHPNPGANPWDRFTSTTSRIPSNSSVLPSARSRTSPPAKQASCVRSTLGPGLRMLNFNTCPSRLTPTARGPTPDNIIYAEPDSPRRRRTSTGATRNAPSGVGIHRAQGRRATSARVEPTGPRPIRCCPHSRHRRSIPGRHRPRRPAWKTCYCPNCRLLGPHLPRHPGGHTKQRRATIMTGRRLSVQSSLSAPARCSRPRLYVPGHQLAGVARRPRTRARRQRLPR